MFKYPLFSKTFYMIKLTELKKHLKQGQVYRTADLEQWSNSVDRYLGILVKVNELQKLPHGLYYYPKETEFGITPPDEDVLICSFLKDEEFLVKSTNAYNSFDVGTSQLYNKRIVYSHKRYGEFELGEKLVEFNFKQ